MTFQLETPHPTLYSVLFVCTNNRCASPIAAALLRRKVATEECYPLTWKIESAGTWARLGERACPAACLTMRARGISLDGHRTRPVSRILLAQFHLVLTMDDLQLSALAIEYPEYAGRMHLLTEMAGQRLGLTSPAQPDDAACQRLARELSQWLALGDDRIHCLARLDTGMAALQV